MHDPNHKEGDKYLYSCSSCGHIIGTTNDREEGRKKGFIELRFKLCLNCGTEIKDE